MVQTNKKGPNGAPEKQRNTSAVGDTPVVLLYLGQATEAAKTEANGATPISEIQYRSQKGTTISK